jgi:hypothetical protein
LELKGNPWPSVVPKQRDNSGLLSNVLLLAAKRHRTAEGIRAKLGAVQESLEASQANGAMAVVPSQYLNYVDARG